MLMRLVWHWAILVLGLYLITFVIPISYNRPQDLMEAALVLIFVNTVVKPLLIFFTLPLVIFSLGLFLLVINAIVLLIVPKFVHGFHVPGFWSAFFGSILLSLITGCFSGYEKRSTTRRVEVPARNDKVIDI